MNLPDQDSYGSIDSLNNMKPIVSIVGRPNVGKSTLFNRMTRTKDALVDDYPGVTRDRHYGQAQWDDVEFTLVDTGGFSDKDPDGFADQIRYQIREAIKDSDIIIHVLDGKEGVSPFDQDLVQMLRSQTKPVFYVVNKIDGLEHEDRLSDFYSLGIDEPIPISAEHRYGMNDFLDALITALPWQAEEISEDIISLAVVGRPNVGKSSLINRILGENRLVVSQTPGTTRDAVDSYCQINGNTYRLIDTAGIRKKGRVSQKIEKFSIIKSLRALDQSDVALIVIDAGEGITEQDVNIAGYAFDKGCGCLFLLNKWDLVKKKEKSMQDFVADLRYSAKFLHFAPVLSVSAITGLRIPRIFTLVNEIYDQHIMRTGTGEMNRILERAVRSNQPPLHQGKRLKFYYMTQTGIKPPTFVCFVNYPQAVHFSYKRYLTNQIREQTGLDKIPIRLIFRLRTGKIEFGAKKAKAGRVQKRGKSKKKK